LYCKESEGAIAWNDEALGIDWKIPADQVILSEKDANHPLLKDSPYLFDYQEDLYK
jgi:dTDP-4-dehydrorhamnose 3,5-epimerase